jgi:hypothetical protein
MRSDRVSRPSMSKLGVLFNALRLVGWMSVIGAVSIGYRHLIEDRTVRR